MRPSLMFTNSTIVSQLSFASSVPFYGAPRLSKQQVTTSSSTTAGFSKVFIVGGAETAERLWLTWQFAVAAARDPTRADAVAAVGELTGSVALQAMLESMQNHPIGREILKDRPRVSKLTIPYEQLIAKAKEVRASVQSNLDSITFGQAYGLFLLDHGFDPDERDAVKYLNSDSDLAYVITRYRQCHDFWHALTGLPPTVGGELGLKWLELFQTGLPVTALSCTAGSLLVLQNNKEQQHLVWNIYLPWARRMCRQMAPSSLLNVYYEKEWETPLLDLRRRLCLEAAPQVDITI